MWPSPEEFREAIQNPKASLSDEGLREGIVAVDGWGLPLVSSGNFASVYKVSCGADSYALRCFLSANEARAERYKALTQFITSDDLEYTVDFRYLQEGVLVRGQWFPAIKMTWVDGIELDSFIHLHASDAAVLRELAKQFKEMCLRLHQSGIAHGDLQHGNIIVTEKGLRLVDYDGMFVPALQGLKSSELGHRNYQHAARSDEHFGHYLDNFSAWLIHVSIEAIARDPSLWRGLRDCLLFSYEDLIDPEHSLAFSIIEHHKDEFVRRCGMRIRHLLTMEPSEVPPLHKEFEIDALPPLPAPEQMREELEKRELAARLGPAPRAVHIYVPRGRTQPSGTRLQVTSEVKYMGLSMGMSELRVRRLLREQGWGLEEAGRDVIRRIQWLRPVKWPQEMMLVGEFPWMPAFGFAYHDGDEVLVKIQGRVEFKRANDFTFWARQHMRGTWVTDGTSRFQFREESAELTYELAAWKPRTRNTTWSIWDFFDTYFPESGRLPQFGMVSKGRYRLDGIRWAADYERLNNEYEIKRELGVRRYANNGARAAAVPQNFGGFRLKTELRFYGPQGFYWDHLVDKLAPHYLYQAILTVPDSPNEREALLANIVKEHGWPDAEGFWGDNCATVWGPHNTTMRWVEDKFKITYEPLAALIDDRTLSEKVAAFFKRKQPPSESDAVDAR